MTARTQRIEVITRGERRRRWSIEQKREIVAESLGPGISPTEIIRKHGVSSGQLYTWRQQLARRISGELAGPSANFARVDVVVAQRQETAVPMAEATVTLSFEVRTLLLKFQGPPSAVKSRICR